MAARSATAPRICATVASGSVQKKAAQPSVWRTSTTRISPPAGLYVARKVLKVLRTASPYRTNAAVCQPWRGPARLARLSLSLPAVAGRPAFVGCAGPGGLGTTHGGATLREQLG